MSKEFQKELKNEVAILKLLDHPNIVRAIETFEHRGRLFIALELCNGGDLYTRDPYTENEAARIAASISSAVSYLHSRGIIHRDLKFENIMFVRFAVCCGAMSCCLWFLNTFLRLWHDTLHTLQADSGKMADVKIIDFGLSKKFAKDEHLKDAVGTVYTMAPELIAGDYGSKADVWSVGVLAFMLLSSSMPFYGKTRHQVIQKIVRGRFHFTSRRWKTVSDEAIDFVQKMLQKDSADRPSADEMTGHVWLQRDDNHAKHVEAELMDSIQASIQAFARYGTLKKLGLMVVAYKSTSSETEFLRRVFKKIDVVQDGEISKKEFSDALSDYDYSPEEVDVLYRGIDVDGTGRVHYIEFLAATLEALGSIDEDRLAEAFDRIDSDDSGFITIEDCKCLCVGGCFVSSSHHRGCTVRDFLGDDVPRETLQRIIDEADLVHDRRISYREFLELWDADTDARMRVTRNQVKTRRRIISREPSFVSSISSEDDTELSEVGGAISFESLRQVSVRGEWI